MMSQATASAAGAYAVRTCHRRATPEPPPLSTKSLGCAEWLEVLLAGGADVVVPEIADYEVRRELLRAGKTQGLARLDALVGALHYLPITSAAMRQAAAFWAQARQTGRPTAPDLALDADAILAGQAATMAMDVVVMAGVGDESRRRFPRRLELPIQLT